MIELRWVERDEEYQPAGEVSLTRRVRVLQYRTLFVPFMAASGDIALTPGESNWIDVPEPSHDPRE